MPEKLPIKVLTDYNEVADLVYAAAQRVALSGDHLLGELLTAIGDELHDDACVEVHNPNIPNEACRRYVITDHGYGTGATSDVWNAALAVARDICGAEAVAR